MDPTVCIIAPQLFARYLDLVFRNWVGLPQCTVSLIIYYREEGPHCFTMHHTIVITCMTL